MAGWYSPGDKLWDLAVFSCFPASQFRLRLCSSDVAFFVEIQVLKHTTTTTTVDNSNQVLTSDYSVGIPPAILDLPVEAGRTITCTLSRPQRTGSSQVVKQSIFSSLSLSFLLFCILLFILLAYLLKGKSG